MTRQGGRQHGEAGDHASLKRQGDQRLVIRNRHMRVHSLEIAVRRIEMVLDMGIRVEGSHRGGRSRQAYEGLYRGMVAPNTYHDTARRGRLFSWSQRSPFRPE